jgi:hypothetical protein
MISDDFPEEKGESLDTVNVDGTSLGMRSTAAKVQRIEIGPTKFAAAFLYH